MIRKWPMGLDDSGFLLKVGIAPCVLEDPHPGPVPVAPPETMPLIDEDHAWLADLKVVWDEDPEPGFVLPQTLGEYLTRYPDEIREAVDEADKDIGFATLAKGKDAWAKEVADMFADFLDEGLEDAVVMYSTFSKIRPGQRPSEHTSIPT